MATKQEVKPSNSRLSGSGFDSMSELAQETAKGMIEYCIECGWRMGQDEGYTDSGRKRAFRNHLEVFCGMTPNASNEFPREQPKEKRP